MLVYDRHTQSENHLHPMHVAFIGHEGGTLSLKDFHMWTILKSTLFIMKCENGFQCANIYRRLTNHSHSIHAQSNHLFKVVTYQAYDLRDLLGEF